MNQLKRIFGHLSFKVAMVIFIIIFPLNILAIYSTSNTMEAIKEQVQLSTQNILDVYVNNLDTRMKRADYYMFDLYNNDTDFIMLRKQSGDTDYLNARFRCMNKFGNEISINQEANGYFVYLPKIEECVLQIDSSYNRNKVALEDYISQCQTMDITKKWKVITVDGKDWVIRLTKHGSIYYGAFICLDAEIKTLKTSINYQDYKAYFNGTGALEKQKDYILASKASKRADLTLVVEISEKEIVAGMTFQQKGQIFTAFIFLTLIPLLILVLRNMVIIPLSRLNKAHRELEVGNKDYRIKKTANSLEFAEAYDTFNQMADNIHTLELENIEKELARKKLELNNLQLQIRPHFLLNTFNLMYNLASRNENTSIKNLLLYLSEYFRYIFRTGKELELFDKELHLIKGYVEAAKIRYPNGLDIIYQIDPDVLLVRVPPLLIHNFIENIVKHNMIVGKTIHVVLNAEYTRGMVNFTISDDGNGMDEDKVLQINQERFEENREEIHVGIHNSVQRIKHFYGTESKIYVESTIGTGTVFTIAFPYDLEEG